MFPNPPATGGLERPVDLAEGLATPFSINFLQAELHKKLSPLDGR
jgi:hypothetical protein